MSSAPSMVAVNQIYHSKTDNICVTPQMVEDILSKLNCNSSMVGDEMRQRLEMGQYQNFNRYLNFYVN